MNRAKLRLWLLLALVCRGAWAAPTAEKFAPTDRVVFLGDSITRGGLYHSFVQLFYATRRPGQALAGFNAGISGDNAGAALRRLPWDVLNHQPTAVTIMLGMNDVGRGLYDAGKTGPAIEQQRQQTLNGYAANMVKLIEALQQAGCKLTLLTPSIYDQTAKLELPAAVGCNDGLGKCGALVKGWAEKYHTGLVDFHTLMTKVNAEGQAKDPTFTIIGRDRVHPAGVGHLIMAYAVLTAQGWSPTVSDVAVCAQSKQCLVSERAKVDKLAFAPGKVSFDCLEESLPFPVPDDAKAALTLVPFTEDLNRELLTVTNLAAGRYSLTIDGAEVGRYTAAELATGVNLADNPKTPMHQQAQAVAKVNATRHGLESSGLRGLAFARHFLLPPKLDFTDQAAVDKALAAVLERDKDPKSFGHVMAVNYPKYAAAEPKDRQTIGDCVAQMRTLAVPKVHHFEVTLVPAG